MELSWLFFILGGIALCFGIYQIATHYRKDTRDAHERIRHIQENKYSPEMGRFAAQREASAAAARTGAASALSTEAAAIADMIKRQTEAEIAQHEKDTAAERLGRQVELEREAQKQVLSVTRRATELEVDNPTYLEIKKKQELDKAELEKRWLEIDQDLKAGFVYAQKEYQYLQMFKQYLFGLYEERKMIESGNGLAKDDQLKLINGHIKAMERDFREQQKRLFQTSTRKEIEGSNENSDRS